MIPDESFISKSPGSKTSIDLSFSKQYLSIPDSLIHVFLLVTLLNFHLYFMNLIQALMLRFKFILTKISIFLKMLGNQLAFRIIWSLVSCSQKFLRSLDLIQFDDMLAFFD